MINKIYQYFFFLSLKIRLSKGRQSFFRQAGIPEKDGNGQKGITGPSAGFFAAIPKAPAGLQNAALFAYSFTDSDFFNISKSFSSFSRPVRYTSEERFLRKSNLAVIDSLSASIMSASASLRADMLSAESI